MNLASLLEGPAFLTHLGVPLHFRGGLTVTPLASVFGLDTDAADDLDQRALDNSVIVRDMGSRSQDTVKLNKLLEYLKELK